VAILVSSDLHHITKKEKKRKEKEKREDEMTTQKSGYNTGLHIRTE
jgi:hypothetical protein